jgi:endoglycosylceramidase
LAWLAASSAGALDGRALQIRDGRLLDERGREITLRGVNARVNGIFDVTFDDGRLPLEDIPFFDAGDADKMRELGFNLLRLPVNWSAFEPRRGRYQRRYLDRIEQIVELCGERGILVLIDWHQDAFSKEIGQDGAPRWVLDRLLGPGNYPYLGGPLTDLEDRRLATSTLQAFVDFFRNERHTQRRFAKAAFRVARRFRKNPHVLGYELMNEPIAFLTGDPGALREFHERVGRAVHRADRRHAIVFEPDAIRNSLNQAEIPGEPFAIQPALYAPHIYTGVFDSLTYVGDPALLAPSMEAAAAEAAAWGAPLLIGEYGIDPSHPYANEWITQQLDLQDRLRAHSTFWLWEEISSGRWGLFDGESSEPGGERLARTTALSRVYARAVPGKVLEHDFDAAANTLSLRYDQSGTEPLELFVPARRYPSGFVLTCDGAPVAAPWDPLDGSVTLQCGAGSGEHVLELVPAP